MALDTLFEDAVWGPSGAGITHSSPEPTRMIFTRAYPPSRPAPGPALWLPFQNEKLLLQTRGAEITLLRGEPEVLSALTVNDPLYLGTLDGVPCLACETDEAASLPPDVEAVGLRALFGRLPDVQSTLAGYASQMLHWRRTSLFCPVCGHATEPGGDGWARRCPQCGYTRYPHVSPAVLALVSDGDRLLLVHKPGWGAMHSIIAGFVEPGESLEECVRREVMEEAGIEVTDIIYQGSQPWPFPHQLMVGFTARYVGGELKIDDAELDGAAWFTRDALPDLPSPISLSRQIIDAWIGAV